MRVRNKIFSSEKTNLNKNKWNMRLDGCITPHSNDLCRASHILPLDWSETELRFSKEQTPGVLWETRGSFNSLYCHSVGSSDHLDEKTWSFFSSFLIQVIGNYIWLCFFCKTHAKGALFCMKTYNIWQKYQNILIRKCFISIHIVNLSMSCPVSIFVWIREKRWNTGNTALWLRCSSNTWETSPT